MRCAKILKQLFLFKLAGVMWVCLSISVCAQSLPEWVKQPPLDDNKFIYGIGSGTDYEHAKKNALTDIAAKFNANVRESYAAAQQLVDGTLSEKIAIDTQVDIQDTRLNHFRVTQSEKHDATFWTLIELDRVAFAADLQKHWFKLDTELSTLMMQIGSQPSLLTMELLQPAQQKNHQLKTVLVQQNVIEPRADFTPLFNRYNSFQQQLNELSSKQFVYLKMHDTNQAVVELISQQLSARGLKLLATEQTDRSDYDRVLVSMQQRQFSDERQAHVAQLSIYIETQNARGEQIGANNFSARGRDYDSPEEAFKKALAGIQQQSKHLSLSALLNISSESLPTDSR